MTLNITKNKIKFKRKQYEVKFFNLINERKNN